MVMYLFYFHIKRSIKPVGMQKKKKVKFYSVAKKKARGGDQSSRGGKGAGVRHRNRNRWRDKERGRDQERSPRRH